MWAERARQWAAGGAPDDVETLASQKPVKTGRDVFLYVISGAKQRNPAAAVALIERIAGTPHLTHGVRNVRAYDPAGGSYTPPSGTDR